MRSSNKIERKLTNMPRELIAPAQEQVAFREYESPPLQANQIRVKSQFGAAKHGSEMASFKGYAGPRGGYDGEYKIFRANESGMVHYPSGLGNMCVGEVIEIGSDVTEVELGERVFRHSSFREEHVWGAAGTRKLPDGVPWQGSCLPRSDRFCPWCRARRTLSASVMPWRSLDSVALD